MLLTVSAASRTPVSLCWFLLLVVASYPWVVRPRGACRKCKIMIVQLAHRSKAIYPTLDERLYVFVPVWGVINHPLLESLPSLPRSLPTPFFAFEPSSPFSPGAYQRGDH